MKKLLLCILLCFIVITNSMEDYHHDNLIITAPTHSTFVPGYVPLPYYPPHNEYINPYPTPHHITYALPSSAVPTITHHSDISSSHNQVLQHTVHPLSSKKAFTDDDDVHQAAKILIKVQTYTVQILSVSMQVKQSLSPKLKRRKIESKQAKKSISDHAQQEIAPEHESVSIIEQNAIEEQTLHTSITKKHGIYCPYCDIRFDNLLTATAHSKTAEHNSKRSKSYYSDPVEYAEKNPIVLERWNTHS